MYIMWPFTNMHELDLDWIIQQIKQQQTDLQNFVALNTIKYAVPFQWNITSQYAQNTLVIDPQDGTAYLSIQPVPQGVQLENTDYWTPVFTLKNFIDPLKAAICRSIPQQEDGQGATQTIPANSLFFVGNTLCTNSAEIPNTSLVIIGSNCVQISVEELLSKLSEQIAQETTDRERSDSQLQQNITAEQNAREQADTQLQEDVTAEQTAREQADTQLQQSITAEQTAREEADTNLGNQIAGQKVNITDVKTAGAVGDGVTDDTAAIQAALDRGGCVYFPKGTYRITNTLYPKNDSTLYGCGTLLFDCTLESSDISAVQISGTNEEPKNNITIKDIVIKGKKYGSLSRFGVTISQPSNSQSVLINNIIIDGVKISGFSRGINTYAGGPGTINKHAYPVIEVRNVRITDCYQVPFCNSSITLHADNIYLDNPDTSAEQMTLDNGCTNCRISNLLARDSNGGGAGILSIDEAAQIELSNITLYGTDGRKPAFRLNCESGNVDNIIVSNLICSGCTDGVSIGNEGVPAQLILSGYRCINCTGKDISIKGGCVFIGSNLWLLHTTESEFNSYPGTKTVSSTVFKS